MKKTIILIILSLLFLEATLAFNVESTFTVENHPPVLDHIDNITVIEGQLVNVSPTATDPDGDNLSFYFTTPLNSSGLWQTTLNDNGTYIVTVTVSDGQLNDSQNVTINVVKQDIISPTINNLTYNPHSKMILLGNKINITIQSSDNVQIDKEIINITLPNSSTITLPFNVSYTPPLKGLYNFTITVNDTSNNKAHKSGHFIVGSQQKKQQYNLINSTGDDLSGKVNVYYSSLKFLHNHSFVGKKTDLHLVDFLLDFEYIPNNSIVEVLLIGLNNSIDDNQTLSYQELDTPATGFLSTIGLTTNYITMDHIQLTFYYNNISFNNENNLRLYKCDNFNFNTSCGLGCWADITSQATQNQAEDYFRVNVTSFSGFSIKEETPSAEEEKTPGGGGGGQLCPRNATIDAPQWLTLHQGENKTIEVILSNINVCSINDIRLLLNNINDNWYTVQPQQFGNLKPFRSQIFTIRFTIPEDASVKEYSSAYLFKTRQRNFKQNITISINKKPPEKIKEEAILERVSVSIPTILTPLQWILFVIIMVITIWLMILLIKHKESLSKAIESKISRKMEREKKYLSEKDQPQKPQPGERSKFWVPGYKKDSQKVKGHWRKNWYLKDEKKKKVEHYLLAFLFIIVLIGVTFLLLHFNQSYGLTSASIISINITNPPQNESNQTQKLNEIRFQPAPTHNLTFIEHCPWFYLKKRTPLLNRPRHVFFF